MIQDKPEKIKTGVKKNGGRRKGAGRKQINDEEKRIKVILWVKRKYAEKAKVEMQKIAVKYNGFI